MSSRHDKNDEFEIGLPAVSTTEWTSPVPGADADTMRGLHLASESVLCLATQTYDAVARGDAAGAQAARASLEQQLALATRLIDELLLDGAGPHTTH
ncbi:hypothetical protein BCh11DRAFT_00991 [Burkholderia sp. Ch1-1]|uniref:Uncharacterized protein n=1 Tax=Paraburkholderia dioscoreae TaxID=2604047 RepID=A0A5Q4ZB59_9BURK|nr:MULTISPECIES: hypothetical protein [Paraburkholderia]EIF33226.1 hypothetical protein BCh11DRAFT_00991 [Burkholderia sp. Ch1-1]MDR8399903.1 hypothetical protein [Paraburkholderia sp. USG1]VVD32059.1 conserved protein of unknown function [Paraburkholderia dioscoreae]